MLHLPTVCQMQLIFRFLHLKNLENVIGVRKWVDPRVHSGWTYLRSDYIYQVEFSSESMTIVCTLGLEGVLLGSKVKQRSTELSIT